MLFEREINIYFLNLHTHILLTDKNPDSEQEFVDRTKSCPTWDSNPANWHGKW